MASRIYIFLIVLFSCSVILFVSCTDGNSTSENIKLETDEIEKNILIEEQDTFVPGNTIESRFKAPNGFSRKAPIELFGSYLRKLNLKPIGSEVTYYDGDKKSNNRVYSAVVDLSIGKKDLHQCADAVMRLRADYFYQEKEYDKIHFNLTNGFRVNYSKWMQGYRVKVVGNKTSWVKKYGESNTEKDYWNYLEFIFTYAGTLSLSKELKQIELSEARIGDVFIRGGSPGHAVIIVDKVVNDAEKKMFLLAQSYMPAQEIQILLNPKSDNSWYEFEDATTIETPEWDFTIDQLKRFEVE